MIALLFAILCILALLKFGPSIYKFTKYYKALEKIPGPQHTPFIGFAQMTYGLKKEDELPWFHDLSFEYENGLFRLWVGPMPTVHVRSPKHLEAILPSTVHITKGIFYKLIAPWLGEGLLTSSGKKWARDRKLITPAFHFNILEKFALVMMEKTEILVKCLRERLEKHPGKPLDIEPFIFNCSLDIICETAMGVSLHAQDNDECEYAQTLHRFSEVVLYRIFHPWFLSEYPYYWTSRGKEFLALIEKLHTYTREVIQKRQQTRRTKTQENGIKDVQNGDGLHKGRKTKAFLDHLLDMNDADPTSFTDVGLREQVDTFMFEGHDTTGVSICWALFCFGNDLEYQEKIHQELEEVFGDSDAPATLKDVAELKYLDRGVKEARRLYPSVPIVGRSIQEDVKIDDKFTIPGGSAVVLSPYLTHRDPDVWPNPKQFNPDRFLPENSEDRHPYAYIPFSAGPRNCIGQRFAQMEEKLTLAAILRNWRVRSIEKHDTIKMVVGLTLRTMHGTYLELIPKK